MYTHALGMSVARYRSLRRGLRSPGRQEIDPQAPLPLLSNSGIESKMLTASPRTHD